MSLSAWRLRCLVVVALLALVLAGCSGQGYAPVSERSLDGSRTSTVARSVQGGAYTVRPGDTLYSIAWRYGKDFRGLARANGIGNDFRIYPGQTLRLTEKAAEPPKPAATQADTPVRSPKPVKAAPATPVTVVKATPTAAAKSKPASKPESKPASRPIKSSEPAHDEPVVWRWPASGKVLRGFRTRGKINNGLDIAGAHGSPVFAAAAGRVVYAGSGLLGYGNLIIINHNQQFLSAYAHNSRLLVKENQAIAAGQKIAEIGNSGATRTMLHFEIRKDGKPVNPLHYLPKK